MTRALPYADDEKDLLIRHYPNVETLMLMLPHRTRASLWAKARNMGLARSEPHWIPSEDDQLHRHYPDMARLRLSLPHRTDRAIENRANTLGLAKPVKKWTSQRQDVLRQLAGRVTDRQCSEIIGGTLRSVAKKRREMKLPAVVPPSTVKPAKVPLIGDILSVAKVRKITLGKITKALGCQRLKPSLPETNISVSSVVKVVKALGGELYVEWKD